MWTLGEAQGAIRDFQFKALQRGYHIALAGGVLNKGYSFNDLDLVALPLDNQIVRSIPELVTVAEKYFGPVIPISASVTSEPLVSDDSKVVRFSKEGKTVDLLFYSRPKPSVVQRVARAVRGFSQPASY